MWLTDVGKPFPSINSPIEASENVVGKRQQLFVYTGVEGFDGPLHECYIPILLYYATGGSAVKISATRAMIGALSFE